MLLVEDNVVNQKVASKFLERAGYDYDIVRNGKLALHAVCESRYDLVLMDCQMPVMDGFEATRAIREAEAAGKAEASFDEPAAHRRADRQRHKR